MEPVKTAHLARLLKPRHIAFVGGNDAAVAMGEARRIGYSGAMWPVNPRRVQLGGLDCFADIDALPEAPDAAFVAVPPSQAITTTRQLSRRGCGGVVCYTAGFRETGTDGLKAEQALVEAAGEMALIGPNCYGVINYLERVALWPFAHGGTSPGFGAAIITQSGMLSSDLAMSQRSLPLAYMISVGNQAVVTIEDLVAHLCVDKRVRAIGVHIEGLRDVGAFARAAVSAAQANTPVVALKTGSSTVGKALTSSHTGSLSGEDDLYDALFARCGVIRVHGPAQFLETLKFLCIAGTPAGNRIAGFTCSGGGGTLLADHGEKVGLEFPAHTPETARVLREKLPAIATVSNPLDYTTAIWGQAEQTRPVFTTALEDEFDAAVLVQDYPAAGLDESLPCYRADGDAFVDAALAAGVPAVICSTLPENLDEATRTHFAARGVAPMQGINETLDAIAWAARWRADRDRLIQHAPADLVSGRPIAHVRAMDEATAKQELSSAGIRVPDGCVSNASQAPAAAHNLGFPVAVKMNGPDLLHKTDLGALALDLTSNREVELAVAKITADVSARAAHAVTDHFLIEAMQPAGIAELIVSIRRDRHFGLAMTIGSGGILAELIGDAVTVLLPCGREDIIRALTGLKAMRLLGGFRGRPAADLNTLGRDLMRLARYMEEQSHRLAEIEINPMFVYRDGMTAIDALFHIDEPAHES